MTRHWRQVYGADVPGAAIPFSFVTASELTFIANQLNIGPAHRFLDLACGQGGPGSFVARETGASMIGLDSSGAAIAGAIAEVARGGTGRHTRFLVADAAAAALAASSVDAVMSIDALQLIPDRAAVLANVERMLKPGGRFAFTTWVARRHGEGPPFPVDYSPLLTAAGLVSEASREPPQWEDGSRRCLPSFDRTAHGCERKWATRWRRCSSARLRRCRALTRTFAA